MLCGKVAAGKSTYANRLAQQKRAVILSVDDLVVRMRTKCEGPAALQQLEAQIREEEERAKEVKEYEEYVKTDEYIKETAEDKLNLVDPNEIIFKSAE